MPDPTTSNVLDYLLVLGGSSDTQLMGVVRELRSRGEHVLMLDHDQPEAFRFEIDRDGGLVFEVGGQTYGPPGAVWSRVKLFTILGHWDASTVGLYVTRAEWRSFLAGLSRYWPDRSFSDQYRLARAENKLLQLSTAAAVGFQIPPTSIFLGKQHALDFQERRGQVVTKSLEVRNVPRFEGDPDRYRVMFTDGVDPKALNEADAADFTAAPNLFQLRLRNGLEYRIIAFRTRLFCYRVKVPVAERHRPDERMILPHVYHPDDAPPGLFELTSAYLERMDLRYGAFDIILDDGHIWFLECNPEGQWNAANHTNHHELVRTCADEIQEFRDCLARGASDVVAGEGARRRA